MIWSDDPNADYNPADYNINTQSVSTHFIDIGQDVDQIDGAVVNVQLPYERVFPEVESWFTTTSNHMVRCENSPGWPSEVLIVSFLL